VRRMETDHRGVTQRALRWRPSLELGLRVWKVMSGSVAIVLTEKAIATADYELLFRC
jgi:hypothetical protein